jgi:hypothetical protein
MPAPVNSLPAVVAAAVEHGWSVVPVGLNKKPLVEWTTYQTERPSLEQVQRWNAELHPPSWAVVTGEISGIVVIDFDGGAGLATMQKYGILSHVRTGSGGAHEYVLHPGFRVPTLNGKSKVALRKILPGTDVRADGGIAVFYGRNLRGPYKRLRALSQPDPWAGELIEKLMALLRQEENKPAVREPATSAVPTACDARVSAEDILQTYLTRERNGAGRNDTGFDLAIQLRDNGYTEDEAAAVVTQYAAAVKGTNTKGIQEAYSTAEVRATLRSVYSRSAREPWRRRDDRTADPPPAGTTTENAEKDEQSPQVGSLLTKLASKIEAKPLLWLWRRHIPRGKLSLLVGNPGLGKTLVTAYIVATVTTGGLWPISGDRATSGDVIFLSAEDDPADTLRPRLEAVGADLSRVHILQGVVAGYTGAGRRRTRMFDLQQDVEALRKKLAEIGNVVVVVVDPLTAYMGGIDSHKNSEVRGVLAPLAELASESGAAIVGVSHMNKQTTGPEALLRVVGSIAFVAAARAAYLVVPDPSDKSRRFFLPIKNNLSPDSCGLAFRVEGVTISDGTIETARVVWEPDPVTVTADEVVRPQSPSEESVLGQAIEWLQWTLRAPTLASEVYKRAAEICLSKMSVRRASEKLSVRKRKTSLEGAWIRSLPDAEDAQGAQHDQGTQTGDPLSTFNSDTPSTNNVEHLDHVEHLRQSKELRWQNKVLNTNEHLEQAHALTDDDYTEVEI